MKNMTLANIANACGGALFCDPELKDREITGAGSDSRLIEKGNLFFALRGAQTDGHKYIPDVYEKAALCVVCEEVPAVAGAYILVENSYKALIDIARFYREQLTIPVVGISGSVGKTSTKEAIASVLSAKYNVLKTAGNYNNSVGLPLTILSIKDNHEIAVIEMGISDFGEMDLLADIAKPDVCVITNIGLCHLENLKDQNGVLKAKTEMFAHRNDKKGAVILNGDDPYLNTIKSVDGVLPLRFGYTDNCRLKATDVQMQGLLGVDFTLTNPEGHRLPCHSPLPGTHVVTNAACAALVGHILGLSDGEIKRGITQQKALRGRSNIIETMNYVIIDDCYNANPISMEEALDLLSNADTRKVAILGDMFELGENEVQMHYDLGKVVVEKGVDVLLCAGNLSENICKGAADAGMKGMIKHYSSRDELIKDLSVTINKGDTVLVKASHGMEYEKIVDAIS